MYPHSDAFQAVYRANHDVAARVDVIAPDGQALASTVRGTTALDLNIVSGGVVGDATALIRRSLTLGLVGRGVDIVPAEAADIFSVLSNNEIHVWAGPVSKLGVAELVPQGVFVITGSDATADAAGVSAAISGLDRFVRVQERVLTRPYTVAHNLDYLAAVQALIRDRVPTMQFRVNLTTSHRTVWHVYDEQTNMAQAAADMLRLIGAQAYMDVDGFCVIDAIPDPSAVEPTWTYAEGVDSTMVSVGPKTSRSSVRNGAIVIGESVYGITPARAEVWDTDPTSPTYVETWGRVPEFINDPRVSTNAQALDAARGEFFKRKGMGRTVDFSIVPNHAQQEDDVVRILHEDTRLDDTFAIQGLTLPLRYSEVMPITTRERRVAA